MTYYYKGSPIKKHQKHLLRDKQDKKSMKANWGFLEVGDITGGCLQLKESLPSSRSEVMRLKNKTFCHLDKKNWRQRLDKHYFLAGTT